MPADQVQHHSQQIPSRLYDRVTHRPMGTLPLPAADAATGFIPACATPATGHYTRNVSLHPIRRGAMPADQVQHHSQQIPSRLYDRVTHRPMGTLPLPAADAATGFIPACATPATGHYTRNVSLHPIRRGAMPADQVQHHSQQIPSRLYDRVTHRPMGTLPLPAADAATGFIPACATPVTGHYTRYVALHPLRGTTPDQKRCNAHGSGAAPLRASTVAATQSR